MGNFVEVRVPKGKSVSRDIEVLPGSEMSISLAEGSEATILLDFLKEGKSSARAFLGKNSKLSLCEIKGAKGTGIDFSSEIILKEGAVFKGVNSVVSGNNSVENRKISLEGKGALATQNEIFWERGKETLKSNILIVHKTPDTEAFASSKGLLSDGGEAYSYGLVKIEKRAQKTNSFLSQHAILLDSISKNDSLPSLEIEANDVKASHSASSGPIDPDAIFYLESRGIPKGTATREIALGFLLPELNILGERERGIVTERLLAKWGREEK